MRRGPIVILVVALGFAGLVLYSLLGNEPIKVTEQRMEQDGGAVDVVGRVENTSHSAEAVTLEVHYYDGQGRALGQDTVRIDRLNGGESREFRSPRRAVPGAASFSIYLNHGRNPYGN